MMAQYTDMVQRPRRLDDTIADLMGGNLTTAAVMHAVQELKRLNEIQRGIELLRADRAVSSSDMDNHLVEGMVRAHLAREIAGHIAKGTLAKISEEPLKGGGHIWRAEAMVVRAHLFDAVVPPLPKISGSQAL